MTWKRITACGSQGCAQNSAELLSALWISLWGTSRLRLLNVFKSYVSQQTLFSKSRAPGAGARDFFTGPGGGIFTTNNWHDSLHFVTLLLHTMTIPNSYFDIVLFNLEWSAETHNPPAIVYSCTSPRFYLLQCSDHVVNTYCYDNFSLTCHVSCCNFTPSEYCCSLADTRPLLFFKHDPWLCLYFYNTSPVLIVFFSDTWVSPSYFPLFQPFFITNF